MRSKVSEIRLRHGILGLPLAAWAIAGAALLLLLALAGAYGFHRDEMYFILAGRHPDFGYVDQPPLTPILSALVAQLLGASPFAVRILPAVVTAVVILLCADMARRLGAATRGQILAALLLAFSGMLGAGHLAVTATFDIFFWTLALWLMIQILAAPAPAKEWGLWLALGLVMGIALENKTLPVFLGVSLAGGVLLARRWDIVRSPGLWAAIAVTFVLWAPNVIWQAASGFPQIEMARNIADDIQGLGDSIKEIVLLLVLAGPLLFPIALGGLVWFFRAPESKAWRPIGFAVLLTVGLMFVTSGKSYYSAGYIPILIAAGAGPLDLWLGTARLRWSGFTPAAVGSGVILALLLLPIVPARSLHSTPIPDIYEESVAQIGWPELADQVRGIVDRLPASERSHTVIVTEAYGQYGGLSFYGHDLPPIYSGHNSVWYWGHPADDTTTAILVGHWGGPPPFFKACESAAVVDNGYDLLSQEQGTLIYVCRGTIVPWSQLWPDFRHIG
jgi:4-amino-4-deoxy-L-arabinose transferase-like glycosyltransferase